VCLCDPARASESGRRDNLARLCDSARDPTRGLGATYDPACLRDPARASGPGRCDYSESFSDLTQGFMVGATESGSNTEAAQGGQMLIPSGGQYDENIDWMFRHSDRQVKDHFFDPRKASPKPSEARGLHPTGAPRGVSRSGSATTMDNLNEHRRTSFKYHKVQLSPPSLGGLTEVDLCTTLPSGVPEPGRLPCSVTRLQLLG